MKGGDGIDFRKINNATVDIYFQKILTFYVYIVLSIFHENELHGFTKSLPTFSNYRYNSRDSILHAGVNEYFYMMANGL